MEHLTTVRRPLRKQLLDILGVASNALGIRASTCQPRASVQAPVPKSRKYAAICLAKHSCLCLVLALCAQFPACLDTLEDTLAVLVELKLGDDDLAGMNAKGYALAIGLLAVDALDVDGVFEAVDGHHLALAVLVPPADDLDLVVFPDRNAADLEAETRSAWKRAGLELAGYSTLYFSRSSLLRGALMMTRRSAEVALKCAFRDFRREEWRTGYRVRERKSARLRRS